jgi:hypothetical protein
MKVVSTEALTKLIQLVKSAFIKVDDVVEVSEIETETPSEVTLATVATTGDYDDLINKPTAGTGIDITNDVISVEGVKDQRNTSTAIKTWTGTKAQYDAITTKDSNTLYNITDDISITSSILEILYPVGSIYITTASTCPLSSLISGSTWQLVSSGRVLQGADNDHSAGSTIEAGLPNITGTMIKTRFSGTGTDCFSDSTTSSSSNGFTSGSSTWGTLDFKASNSNNIYGSSSTVQPPAYVVNIFRRTL